MSHALDDQTAMDRWVAMFATRDDLAVEYARLLKNDVRWKGWVPLNLAIIDRWSKSGLGYVKEKAWAQAAVGGDPE